LFALLGLACCCCCWPLASVHHSQPPVECVGLFRFIPVTVIITDLDREKEREREREREKLKGNKTVVILPIRFEQEEEEEERISCREREPLPTSVGPTVGQSVSDSTHLVDTFSIKKIKGRPVGGKSIPSSIHPGSCTFYKVEEFDFDFFSFGLAPAPKKKRVQFCHAQTLLVCCLREPTTDTAGNARRFDFSLVPVRFIFILFFCFDFIWRREKKTKKNWARR
jgi:hypothetical protein